ncbi:hypothetical protein J2S74_002147 [Evansella vedderi]|uniref:Uncharacterized protein n=1 Tax=Evansella vedderi TaxID=38282 RepID=A0ABT9ZWB3_9BACI|nr:hypothetical protein [Evansella vedderi]MDQ0254768.1 hypothetical protein [Evansella vedderi]
MESYEIHDMIIDNELEGEESVTVAIAYNGEDYLITFNKADLEIINKWIFEDNKSLPATLPEYIIESLREEIKRFI